MRIGILGGSFNPVHNGHLRLALESKSKLGLDRVEFIPAAQPPHKKGVQLLPFEQRCALLRSALEMTPCLKLNCMEGQRQGPSYTIDTIDSLERQYAANGLYFILGCPDLLTLPKWHDWGRLLQKTNLIVAERDSCGYLELADFVRHYFQAEESGSGSWQVPGGQEIIYISVPRLDISSSLIRSYLRQGHDIRYLVPEKIVADLEKLGWNEKGIDDLVGQDP